MTWVNQVFSVLSLIIKNNVITEFEMTSVWILSELSKTIYRKHS